MTTVEIGTAQFNDRGEVIAAEAPAPVIAGSGGQGLVLPDEVLADLAGQLVARARAGEPVALTGHGGCCRG